MPVYNSHLHYIFIFSQVFLKNFFFIQAQLVPHPLQVIFVEGDRCVAMTAIPASLTTKKLLRYSHKLHSDVAGQGVFKLYDQSLLDHFKG